MVTILVLLVAIAVGLVWLATPVVAYRGLRHHGVRVRPALVWADLLFVIPPVFGLLIWNIFSDSIVDQARERPRTEA